MDASSPPRVPDGGFHKRTHSVQSFLAGSSWLVRNLPRLLRATLSNRVDARFREQLLLVVSAANDCRYCTRAHTSMASVVGVDDETIEQILDADIETAAAESEQPALLFALHYAETNGTPDPQMLATVEAAYPPRTAADIVALTRAMHVLNLFGNSVDASVWTLDRRIQRGLQHARERCPI